MREESVNLLSELIAIEVRTSLKEIHDENSLGVVMKIIQDDTLNPSYRSLTKEMISNAIIAVDEEILSFVNEISEEIDITGALEDVEDEIKKKEKEVGKCTYDIEKEDEYWGK